MKAIETERLIIRNWQENDAPELYAICLDPELRRSGIGSYKDIDESLQTIRVWMEHDEMWAIVHKADNRLIGFIGLGDMNRYSRYKELEYAVAAEYRNKGYATEVLKRMLDFAFGELGLSVVAAWVRSFNVKCVRVLEKCAFTHEGTLRRYARDQSDTLCYSILKEEWEGFRRLQ